MEPPDLIAAEEICETPSRIGPPKLSPVLELPAQENSPQLIVPNEHDLNNLIDYLELDVHLPYYNVDEKIIIALDTTREENSSYFKGKRDENISPYYALKSAVEMFVKLKLRLNKNHQIALVLLNGSEPYWYYNFTSNVKEFVNILNNVFECQAGEKFDLTPLFANVASRIRTCDFFKDSMIPPPYVVRIVLLYSRSHTVPDIQMMESIQNLFNCPYFFLDVLCTHDPVSEDNNCKKVFKFLQNLEVKGYSYFFNVGRNLDALMRSMVKLVGHPLQRPIQINSDYSL